MKQKEQEEEYLFPPKIGELWRIDIRPVGLRNYYKNGIEVNPNEFMEGFSANSSKASEGAVLAGICHLLVVDVIKSTWKASCGHQYHIKVLYKNNTGWFLGYDASNWLGAFELMKKSAA